MIEQVGSNIFRIEIPLPKSPLKATNSYFIRGNERNLLIDTGFNQTECREAMDVGQKQVCIFHLEAQFVPGLVHGRYSPAGSWRP